MSSFRTLRGLSLRDRFLLQTEPHPDGCWLWKGRLLRNGYGRIRVGGEAGGKSMLAHRAAHELFIGPIPEGFTIDHVRARGCQHRHCVNPAHLEAVTHRENTMRGDTLAAANAAKTRCIHDHPFNEKNTYVAPDGKRACRACRRAVDRRYRERRAVAA